MNDLRSATRSLSGVVGLRWIVWIWLASSFLGSGLSNPYTVGTAQDWKLQAHMTTSSYRSLALHHQFPAWDPYECGGIYGSGNLQNNGSSPTQLLAWLFGLMPGWKIAMWLMILLGLEGGYQYARAKGIEGVAALASAALFAFSGRFAQAMVDGHPQFLGFELFPWVVLCLERGFQQWRWSLLGGLFMAWIFADGGAVTTPMIALMLLFHALYFTGEAIVAPDGARRWYRPLAALALMGLVTALLSAVILLPALSSWVSAPRVWERATHYSLPRMLGLLFTKPTLGGLVGEGTSYVGELALFAFLAMVLLRDRLVPQLLLLFVVALALSTGDGGLFGLYDLQKKLPFYKSLRNPFRYTLFAAFYLALGAGRGLALLEHHALGLRTRRLPVDEEERRLEPNPGASWRIVADHALVVSVAAGSLTLAALASWQVFQINRARVAKVFTVATPPLVEQRFRQSLGNPYAANVFSAANMGSLACIQAQPFRVSPELRADRSSEYWLTDPKAGRLSLVDWTPHRVRLDLELRYRTGLVANMNYHPGWRVDRGTVTEYRGLLAASLPAGRYRLTLYFSDFWVNLGALVTLITLLVIAGYGVVLARDRWRSRRERRPDEGLAIAGGPDREAA